MTPAESSARWTQLCLAIRKSPDTPAQAEISLRHLQIAYAEPHRHYHNFAHIADCLHRFDSVRSLAQSPGAVEFALWFHDAVYDPHSTTNEEDSAALAEGCLRTLGAIESFVQQVRILILATKTHLVEPATDAALLVDIDLSILGQPAAAFTDYETKIRQEYAWVPAAIFAAKRAEILRRFLSRPRLYATDFFFTRLEHQARANLAHSLQKLASNSS